MSAHETTTETHKAKAARPTRTKAERERAQAEWMRQFAGAVKMGFEVDVEDYIRRSGGG